MVYKIFLNGENVDAEFGGLFTLHENFIGTYGQALKRAEELFNLIDEGLVSVAEKTLSQRKEVYVATKCGTQVKRLELN